MSSPYLNRFIQPDSLIPDPSNPQAWNRYAYVTNRPINFNDPTGYKECDPEFGCSGPLPKPTPAPPTLPSDYNSHHGQLNNHHGNGGGGLVSALPAGPACTAIAVCYGTSPSTTNLASYYPTANLYYWQIASYAETAYSTATRFNLTNSGLNYWVVRNNFGYDPIFGLNNGGLIPASSVNSSVTNSFIGWGALGMSFGAALAGNLIDYGWGANAGTGIISQQFAVSTVVDTVIGYTVGAGVALGVGLLMGATAPVWAVAAVTVGAGIGVMALVDYAGIPDMAKIGANTLVDDLQGE